MLDKLEAIKERFDEVSQLIVDPEIHFGYEAIHHAE